MPSDLIQLGIEECLKRIGTLQLDAFNSLTAVHEQLRTLDHSYNTVKTDLPERERSVRGEIIAGLWRQLECFKNVRTPQPEVPPGQRLPEQHLPYYPTVMRCMTPISGAEYPKLRYSSSTPHRIETGGIPQSISNKISQHISLTPDLFGPRPPQPVTLSDIACSLIDIRHPFEAASVTARDIRYSLLLLGHVYGDVHLNSLHGCVVVLSAETVRISASTNSIVCSLSNSPPVMESSTGICFTSAPSSLVTKNGPRTTREDCGNQIIDTSWNEHGASPNWQALDQASRPLEADWERALEYRPDEGLDMLLQRVGVGAFGV